MTDEELELYYSNLLIMQYNNKPRAIATIRLLVAEIIANQIIQQVNDGFNLETAIGAQLTMLGTYRNAPRTIYGLSLTKEFFGMPIYTDPSPGSGKGFALYDTDPDPSWYFILYSDDSNPIYILSDSDLRTLIMYLAQVNSSGFGLGEIDIILFNFFGTYLTLDDNGDMTITYTHDPSDPNNLFAVVDAIGALPRPSGVTAIIT